VGTNFDIYVLACLAVSVASFFNNSYANQSLFVRIDEKQQCENRINKGCLGHIFWLVINNFNPDSYVINIGLL
jgi:hypothetical protein